MTRKTKICIIDDHIHVDDEHYNDHNDNINNEYIINN